MKKSALCKILLPLIVVILLTTCDSLIEPMAARLNPYDSENPVPLPDDFSLGINTDVREEFFVELSWTSVGVDGYLIIRKAESAPGNIWDGDPVALVDGNVTAASDEYPDYGCRVYYAIFSYKAKSENTTGETLSLDGKSIKNYELYNFTGPVVDSMIGYAVWNIFPSDNGYIESGENIWNKSGEFLYVETFDNSGPEPVMISCLSYEFTQLPSGNIDYAELILTKQYGNAWEGELQLGLLKEYWEDQSFSEIDDATAVESAYIRKTEVVNTDEKIYISVFNFYRDWTTGIKPNMGMRLISYDLSSVTGDPLKVYSSDAAGELNPVIRLYYYKE